ncbi:pyrroloquinoline quinone biosynthesis protein D [Gammaproteobacteria bacterium]
MTSEVTLSTICVPSEAVVARKIEGEVIIVPLIAGVGDADDALYTMNPTGQAIWERLDGQRTLHAVATTLADEFDAPLPELETDVLGFVSELTNRGILQICKAT